MYEKKDRLPQGTGLDPAMRTIFALVFPIADNTLTALYADDTAIPFLSNAPTKVSYQLQIHLKKIPLWLNKRYITVNAIISLSITV